MALDDSVYASPGMDNASLITQMQGMSIKKETKIAWDHALFSWMEDKDARLTNGATTSSLGAPQVQSDYNLWSKRRFKGQNEGTQGRFILDKVSEQPAVATTYPRKEFIPYKPREARTSVPLVLDMVEHLKKSLTNISLWDLLSIPQQKNRLKEALLEVEKHVGRNVGSSSRASEERF